MLNVFNFTTGTTVNLPDPADIPIPQIAAAAAKVAEVHAAQDAAWLARDAASAARLDAISLDRQRGADQAYEKPGVPLKEPRLETIKAEKLAEDTQAELTGILAAADRAGKELREAIAVHGEAWAEVVRPKAQAAVTLLTTSTRQAEQASADLDTHVGVLAMIAESRANIAKGGPALTSLQGGRHAVPLSEALPHMRRAVAEAAGHVREL